MRKKRGTRTRVMLALAGLLASLVTFASSETATAAESLPELQWPAVSADAYHPETVTSPQGDVTVGCYPYMASPLSLATYDANGNVARQIDHTNQIDGVNNCIYWPAVDKNGVLYGAPEGGTNLLAYEGNTLKWKYPFGCTGSRSLRPAIGADGNIYAINSSGRLVGLAPTLESGTAQPAKVLDVAVTSSGCGTDLRPLKNGIAVVRDSGWVYFYSYEGTFVSSVNSRESSAVINADGRLFYPTYTGSNPRSFSVSAYDYGRGETMWTTSASTPGANVQWHQSYALPGGGVFVIIREQKMVADGIPASPTVYVTTMMTLNQHGNKVWSEQLPDTDSNGDPYGNTYYSVDTTGKVVVTRAINQSLGFYPYKAPRIEMSAFNAYSGAVVYSGTMRGNTTKSEGTVYGFSLKNRHLTLPIGQDTLYLAAEKCAKYCYGYSENLKLYAVKVPGLGMDYPRGAVLATTPRPSAPYIALGDSFSSGEGVEPFEAGTDNPGVNTCHQSEHAYAKLLVAEQGAPSLGSDGFRACSGAVTKNITDAPQWNEGTQLDLWPDTTTQLVTLTIGGNDIGFGPVIETCAWPTNDCDSAFQTANQKVANLGDALKKTYTNILTKMPNAQVFVIGYPPMFAAGTGCVVGPNQTDYPFYNEDRKQKAIDLLDALNTKIHDSVQEIRTIKQSYFDRLRFVDATNPNSPFIGHDICSSDPYFHGLILQNTTSSFHPNSFGQEAYAELVRREIGE